MSSPVQSMISKQIDRAIDIWKLGPTHRLSGSRIKPFPTEPCVGEAHPHISYLTDSTKLIHPSMKRSTHLEQYLNTVYQM